MAVVAIIEDKDERKASATVTTQVESEESAIGDQSKSKQNLTQAEAPSSMSAEDDMRSRNQTESADDQKPCMLKGCSNASADDPEEQWTFDAENNEYIVQCPHCKQPHLVPAAQLFCCQFTCGADAVTGSPLKPHMKPQEIERLRESGRIVGGCGGRFKFNPRKGELLIL
eukprot:gnl/MRDRNA2_/MRDRNA2_28356_c0_seq1.p1 gnl/MRDRNA2_/MRDRNA2_28356_c0~~gnl/MRDRNA2_/MRDRNA2_28356_c0_seq1.p1  ORF type:complete len:170 (-),score=40.36 gnl/MRDRNA2_/MRDRNA2_28356_c0_seq1:88-597(-)